MRGRQNNRVAQSQNQQRGDKQNNTEEQETGQNGQGGANFTRNCFRFTIQLFHETCCPKAEETARSALDRFDMF